MLVRVALKVRSLHLSPLRLYRLAVFCNRHGSPPGGTWRLDRTRAERKGGKGVDGVATRAINAGTGVADSDEGGPGQRQDLTAMDVRWIPMQILLVLWKSQAVVPTPPTTTTCP